MENTRYGHKKDVRMPYKFENNHAKTSVQLYGEEIHNHRYMADQTKKIGYNIAMRENFNIAQNKTNLFTDPLYIQSRPIGVMGNTFVGLKTVRPIPSNINQYKWTFTPTDSSMKAPFSSYLLPRDRTPRQFIPV